VVHVADIGGTCGRHGEMRNVKILVVKLQEKKLFGAPHTYMI
jgi:hypothetical protein